MGSFPAILGQLFPAFFSALIQAFYVNFFSKYFNGIFGSILFPFIRYVKNTKISVSDGVI